MSVTRGKEERLARRPGWFWWVVAVAIVATLGWAGGQFLRSARTEGARNSPARKFIPDGTLFAAYGKSPSCQSCHEEAFSRWAVSHHALAERPVHPALDGVAFQSHFKIRHGSQVSSVRQVGNKFELVTTGLEGPAQAFTPERVIGIDPLRQYLIPAPGGRFQVTELAFAPGHRDWFDVYGEEDRRPGEWGHWTGRGMTWNVMCATCHNTRVRKNYDEATDSYSTRMAEMGVGCEACHGPMADHNNWQARHPKQTGDPTVHRIDREAMFAACGACHSRRGELTGDFQPGEKYFDHFSLTIPDETDLFYPDGQIRDEDFEFTAFLGSRMHAAGVRCVDCHEPHLGKVRLPGNNLCLVCHGVPKPPAPKIDTATHSHHPAGGRGDNCVDCHMPQTVYMQRHARHDHGFTIPDPLLTKQFGIPNACTRCHADHDVDWSLAAVEKWYGPRMERPTRDRAQILARARVGQKGAASDLVRLLQSETNGFWRAVSANLLRHWANEPNIAEALLARLADPEPMVRAMTARALEPLVSSGREPVLNALRERLGDPVRLVRLDAAWALHATLDTNSPAGHDLLSYLRHNADQPSGAFQLGVFHLDRGDLAAAMSWLRRAVNWDTHSAPLYQALAVGLSLEGKSDEAVQALETACRLSPQDAEYQFKLGLALNEAGHLDRACAALEKAVKLDPDYAQAWYNLGLAYNASGQTDAALDSLVRAESTDNASPQIPYARATILARLGRVAEARAAVRRALEVQPGYAEAVALREQLGE